MAYKQWCIAKKKNSMGLYYLCLFYLYVGQYCKYLSQKSKKKKIHHFKQLFYITTYYTKQL